MKPYYWLIVAISALTGFIQVSAQNADTVYITVSLGMVSVVQDGSTITFDASQCYGAINSPRTQKTRVSLFNGATPAKYWYFNDYIFKISGSVVTSTSAWLTAISNLNPGQLKSYRKIAEYRVVTSLPTVQDPAVTYLVGAKDTILISGLNGNVDKIYRIDATVINPATGDNITLRFNNVLSGVYDYRYSYAGSTSTTASNAQTSISISPSTGTSSINTISAFVYAETGRNRQVMGEVLQGGANQQTISGMLIHGGNWRDNSTNMTSMCFRYASITGGYGVGTIISVFALRP